MLLINLEGCLPHYQMLKGMGIIKTIYFTTHIHIVSVWPPGIKVLRFLNDIQKRSFALCEDT